MYNIVLLGAGNIGSDKPDELDSPKTEFPLTHAHALYNLHREKKINWLGIIDTNAVQRYKATKKWGCLGFELLEEIKQNIDIIIVAISTDTHYGFLKEVAIKRKPKIIIIEKPFCNNLEQAKEISALAKRAGIKIIVNYTRRFIKEYSWIKIKLMKEQIYNAKLTYGHGLIREACHAIDLFNWWFGDLLHGNILGYFGIADYSEGDKTYPVFLSYRYCPSVFLCPVDGREYCIFEIDIFTDKGRILISDSGATYTEWGLEKEGIYGNYNRISHNGTTSEIELRNGLTNLYTTVLNGEEICTEKEAIEVHKVYEKILN